MKKNQFYLWLEEELDEDIKIKIPYSSLYPCSYVTYFIYPTINERVVDYPLLCDYKNLIEKFSLYGECVVYALDCCDFRVIEIDMHN